MLCIPPKKNPDACEDSNQNGRRTAFIYFSRVGLNPLISYRQLSVKQRFLLKNGST